ncbi:MAG: hypothetical protein A2147_04605 [Chloroflexi bacterium RBG_16_57_8]|nr:MAG: hypothetical protein A2147_04605 [Chloroflexi bacterium RBG_16_57_8]
MTEVIDLRKVSLETSSSLWQIIESEGEQVLQVTGHTMEPARQSGAAAYLDEDHTGTPVVALIDGARHNYGMQAEMRFLGHHHPMPRAGWFGFAIRAQDILNFEIVWFMPNAETGNTAAYVPVPHGIVPWWTEAYANQKKGAVPIPADAWFRARVDVVGDEFTVHVDDRLVFTKKVTYYLQKGRPGFFVGTATDVAFRRVLIKALP